MRDKLNGRVPSSSLLFFAPCANAKEEEGKEDQEGRETERTGAGCGGREERMPSRASGWPQESVDK